MMLEHGISIAALEAQLSLNFKITMRLIQYYQNNAESKTSQIYLLRILYIDLKYLMMRFYV